MMNTEPESEKTSREAKTWLDSARKEFGRRYLWPRYDLEGIVRVLLLVLLGATAFWGAKKLFTWLSWSKETQLEKTHREVERWLDNATKEFSRCYLRPRILETVVRILLLVLLVTIAFWGAKEFAVWLSSGEDTPQLQALGTHQHHVYFFNQDTQKVYQYDPQINQEKEVFDLAPYEAFVWSHSGDKIVFVSRQPDSMVDLYIVDLAEPTPQPKLITEQETGINFPCDIIIQGNLPLVWDENDDRIAFVARKQTEDRDALFVIAADGSEYYRLSEMDRITSLAWAGDQIIFVAFENDQKKRFVVNFDGGALKEVEEFED